ncbi:SCP2 sterol-binding domain-containing protein [Phaeovulum vinaykumarii]|uniref:SCP-2 sterol transfer family protein n=1 Tax=Phaeovulum vinaykumarii TaxID=407234 RepID=A0A1N7MH58_9RHOB|nr:SCP2 sterol-binding domain-containing protein [Phaeovulum vinaykumarii]SIS85387.1 SCP-2 sterol transfer family protein [Phaeovulum vinaykumarii]SOC12225.1 SCP-2 sterol transfer family protein [Phaeovulum vinaykumarii]
MSKVIEVAVSKLSEKLAGGFPGVAKFVIPGEGEIIADAQGVRAAEPGTEAEVTLTASAEVFRGMLDGEVNPTAAFMTGKLKIDGAMGLAMQLGARLG